MHYVRFLKPPQVSNGILSAKLTITSDLGDEFLNADLPLQLVIHHSIWKDSIIDDGTNPNIVHWRAGNRELAISIPLPRREKIPTARGPHDWQLLVQPCLTGIKEVSPEPARLNRRGKPLPARAPKYEQEIFSMADVLKINRGQSDEHAGVQGLVLAAESAKFNLVDREQKLPGRIERTFCMDFWDDADDEFELTIEEETGNSIARHVWDAGVVFSALLRDLCVFDDPAPTYLPALHTLLQSGHGPDDGNSTVRNKDHDPLAEYAKALNVLELGSGCAIVSATLSHCLPFARVIATDMPEATDIATKNLDRNRTRQIDRLDAVLSLPSADSSYSVLDWTAPLPLKIAERKWDLILVADCTYNSDVVPALVDTLRRLVDLSPDVLIAVALKWRHDSEAVVHELMKEKGLMQVDKHTERCGNFDFEATGKEEEIEFYLFKSGEGGKEAERARKRKLSAGKEEGPAKK